jgi:SAM-dependent methyltransferase
MQYDDTRFKVNSFDAAKRIILTPHEGKTTDERWLKETQFILDLFDKNFTIDEYTTFLDYGCGIGRIAKELILKYNCQVVGVDSSKDMLEQAKIYCNSNRFIPMTVEEYKEQEWYVTYAYSIWTLQHILEIEEALELIAYSEPLKFLVMNMTQRCIPCKDGWYSDYKDIFQMLKYHFDLEKELQFNDNFFGQWYKDFAFIHIYS